MQSTAQLMDERFREFTEQATRFSREIVQLVNPGFEKDPVKSAEINLQIAKTIFGKWSIEILALLYSLKSMGFEEIRRSLGGISSRVLSQKLKRMEDRGFIQREVLSTRPPRVKYSLTKEGLTISKLGEPVFLFIRLREGMLHKS